MMRVLLLAAALVPALVPAAAVREAVVLVVDGRFMLLDLSWARSWIAAQAQRVYANSSITA
jgi:hypothetical protein